MKNFRQFWFFSLILLVSYVHISGKDRRREEIEAQEKINASVVQLQKLKAELEKIREGRFQDKRNAIETQQAFQENWNDLKRDVDRLSNQKTRKEESFLRIKAQKSEKKTVVEQQEARYKGFWAQLKDKNRELDEKLGTFFPYQTELDRKDLAANTESLSKSNLGALLMSFDRYINIYQKWLYESEKTSISRGKLPVKGLADIVEANAQEILNSQEASGARIVAGQFITIGGVLRAFVSTESKDVAILVKTGRMDKDAYTWVESLKPETRTHFQSAMAAANLDQGSFLLFPMDVILKNATSDGFISNERVSFSDALHKEIEEGGWVMYPIMFVALFGLIIILERAFHFLRKDQAAASLVKKVILYIEQGKISQAQKLVEKSNKSVSKVLHAILSHSNKERQTAEEKAYEVMLDENPRIEARISTINILAAAAPLVGLLGTVSGMVTLFGVITVHGTSDPKLMAGGISEALIATKWGLGVAVPLLIIYNLMDLWAARIISNMEKYGAQVMNALYTSKTNSEIVS